METPFTDPIVQTHCTTILNTSVLLLWRLGVFHWDECRRSVLRHLPADRELRRLEKIAEGLKRAQEYLLKMQGEEQNAEMTRRRETVKQMARGYERKGDQMTQKKLREKAACADEAAFAAAGRGSNVYGNRVGSNEGGGRLQHQTIPTRAEHEMSDGEVTEDNTPRIRGGYQQPMPTFNPSTMNNRDVGDQDTTLLDVSPVKETPTFKEEGIEDCKPLEDDTANTCYGINMFLASDKRENKPRQLRAKDLAFVEPSPPERSLQDVYADNPSLKLAGLDADSTLHLAGHTAKHVALEATFAFLQKCIAPADRDTVWAQMITAATTKTTTTAGATPPPTSLVAVPAGLLDHPGSQKDAAAARAPTHQLLGNCIATLQAPFATPNATSLTAVFNRCIALCDALGDTKRTKALDATLKALQWLVLGLAAKETQRYRATNAVLVSDFDVRYPLDDDEVQGVVVSAERRGEERALLAAHRETFEGLKVPFRAKFVACLQALMAVEGDS